MELQKYEVWVSGQKSATRTIVLTENSVDARQQLARKYRLELFDIVARRVEGSNA